MSNSQWHNDQAVGECALRQHDEQTGDLRSAVQTLAADNARLCGRLLTAEAVVEYCRTNRNLFPDRFRHAIDALIDAHDAGKPS